MTPPTIVRALPALLLTLALPAAADEPAQAEPAPAHTSSFSFGSYGRVNAATDLAGRSGRNVDLVRYGARLDESSYAELQLTRLDAWGDVENRVVFTLALLGPFFHFDGIGSDTLAVRQLFNETRHALVPGLALWAGSRIVRGDDVYLLDFWPLDNMNVMGGGARYDFGDKVEALAHVGLYRLADQYQHQVTPVPARYGVGVDALELLDRPRTVGAFKLTYWPAGRFQAAGVKVVGYGEAHALPAGQRTTNDNRTETLPADGGFLAGAQLGAWHGPSRSFANAYVRWAQGLAAYNPLESPFRAGTPVTSTARAAEFLAALVGNGEWGPFGVQVGAYYRAFRDPASNAFDRGATQEGVVAVRPHWWFLPFAGVAAEASWQAIATSMLDDRSGDRVGGSLARFALMPYVTPAGQGAYTRPHLRLMYVVTLRDAAAMNLYAEEDSRSRQPVEQFLGIGAEWWFDSSYR